MGKKIALAIAPDALVTAIIAANITDIKPGSYIGTAAVPQADGVRAFEIQVCPDSMRGVGEGPSLGPPQSTMTNGAVGDVVVTQGRNTDPSLRRMGGKPLWCRRMPRSSRMEWDPARCWCRAHVIITATQKPDGSLTPQRVGIGQNGLTPPM